MKRLLVILALLVGCGASQSIDTAREILEAQCAAAEWRIVERENSTEAQDKRDLAKIRLACDSALGGLEVLGYELERDSD